MFDRGYVRVHFLDVGQGSSSIIEYHNELSEYDELVVIDCGRHKAAVPYTFVNEYVLTNPRAHIPALILTHNDSDHSGGAPQIIRNCWVGRESPRIGRIYLSLDASTGTPTIAGLLHDLNDEELNRIVDWDSLHPDAGTQVLHRARVGGEELVIEALATRPENGWTKKEAMNPNATCGVIRLRYNNRQCVLFCGDLVGRGWIKILYGHDRIACEAVAVSHHGGKLRIDDVGEDPEGWFFREIVEARKAIFSFGTMNPYDHPQSDVVGGAMTSGATVLCTQITRALRDREESLVSGVVQPTRFSLSWVPEKKRRKKPERRHVACAGSITLWFGPDGAAWGHQGDDSDPVCGFEDLDELQAAIRKRCRYKKNDPKCHEYCFAEPPGP